MCAPTHRTGAGKPWDRRIQAMALARATRFRPCRSAPDFPNQALDAPPRRKDELKGGGRHVTVTNTTLEITLRDGRSVAASLRLFPVLALCVASVALDHCGSPSSSLTADGGSDAAIAPARTDAASDGGTCASCVTDLDCRSCGSTPRPGYAWCCGGAVAGCYEFSTSCPPMTPPDSGGDVGVDGRPESASCPGSVDGGGDSGLTSACSSGGCVGADWAEWPMPNSSVDVAAGAPNPERYAMNGDATVTDGVTSLMWQEVSPSSAYAWADAQAYCTGIMLGGHVDWRLPSRIELFSIVDYSHNLPALDPAGFPGEPPTEVWSSTLLSGSPPSARTIFFAAGDTGNASLTEALFVRCARGPAPASSPALPTARYTVANGTVYDTRTMLTWQQAAPSGAYTWADAKSYCASVSLNGAPGVDQDSGTADGAGGAGGWRVPTAKELLTIVDVTKSTSPSIDCEAFGGAHADSVWSSTLYVGFSRQPLGWAVHFDAGRLIALDVTSLNAVRCVR
jgi:hypothetical protein